MYFPSHNFNLVKLLWVLCIFCIFMLWLNYDGRYEQSTWSFRMLTLNSENNARKRPTALKLLNLENPRAFARRLRPSKIISYPVNLENAKAFVQKLRSKGSPPKLKRINTLHQNVKFAPISTKACHTEQDVVIIIKTSISTREDRMSLRKNWLNPNYLSKFGDIRIKYAFVIGNLPTENFHRTTQLWEEVQEFGDFIVADFTDSYLNLTLKTLIGFRWALEFCPQFQYYVGMDDDMLVNIKNVLEFLRDPSSYPNRMERELLPIGEALIPSSHDFYAGLTYINTEPVRDRESKYFLSKKDFPHQYFPPYVGGGFRIWSRESVQKIYLLAPYVRHLAMEDVFVGIVANKLQIPLFDISDLVISEVEIEEVEDNDSYLSTSLAVHGIFPLKLRNNLWRQANE